ncbi:MAG TPA: hypothetical protein PKC08_01720 [Pseudomonadales bacterium]|nr:hypothetical protein [Pseudomonadales bacterium]
MSDLSSVLAPETAKRKTWRLRNRPALSNGSDGVAWIMVILVLTLTLLFMPAVHGGEVELDFDIPPSTADKALVLFAKQANIQLLFPYEDVSTVQLKGLTGRYSVTKGIEVLVAGTCLEASASDELSRRPKMQKQKKRLLFMRHNNCSPHTFKFIAYPVLAATLGVPSVSAQNVQSSRSVVLGKN